MNFKLLNAECEVRRGFWGPDIGGLQEEKENIADLLKRLEIENQKNDAIRKEDLFLANSFGGAITKIVG